MKYDIGIEFIELMPDMKKKIVKGEIAIREKQHLRKILHKYCNEIAHIQRLGRYSKNKPMFIELKNSNLKKYCQPFTISNNGRVIPLSDCKADHDWTYDELLRIQRLGLSDGDESVIRVFIPEETGLGDDGLLPQIADEAQVSFIAEMIILISKYGLNKIINTVKDAYYIKKYRQKISSRLQSQIVHSRKTWNVDEIKNLFCFSIIEAERLLKKNRYIRTNGSTWKANKISRK